MSKKVKSVEITFENLDYVDIPVEYFGEFRISGIRTTIERLALNAILQRTTADCVEFELLSQVDDVLPELTQDLSFVPDEQSSLLRRIVNRRDITSLDLHYDDTTTDQFYIPWEDDKSETYNKLLHTQVNNDGNLLVTIQRN